MRSPPGAPYPVASAGLVPLDDVHPVGDGLSGETGAIMLVGHLPFLARLAGLLLAGSAEASPVSCPAGLLSWFSLLDDAAVIIDKIMVQGRREPITSAAHLPQAHQIASLESCQEGQVPHEQDS